MINKIYFSLNRDSSPRTLAQMMLQDKDFKFASFWLKEDSGCGLGSGIVSYKGRKPTSKEINDHVSKNGFLSPIISTPFYGTIKDINIINNH